MFFGPFKDLKGEDLGFGALWSPCRSNSGDIKEYLGFGIRASVNELKNCLEEQLRNEIHSGSWGVLWGIECMGPFTQNVPP